MLYLNKYCFFSDIISGQVLIYNSRDDNYILVNESEYHNIINFSNEKIRTNLPLFKYLYKTGIFVVSKNNCFDEKLYNSKITALRKCMNSMCVFKIVIADFNRTDWVMDNISFIQCIKAIKDYGYKLGAKITRIILSYINLDAKILEHLDIIERIMNGVDYHTSVTFVDGNNTEKNNIIRKLSNLKIEFSIVQDNNFIKNSVDSSRLVSYEKYLVTKSMYHYYNLVQSSNFFPNGINSFDLLCPCLMENYYIIEYGILIKKCYYKKMDHSNIVGIVDDSKLVFNKNVSKFVLSMDRLNEQCKKCVFVYICTGQNCKVCNNNNITTCMPMKKIITQKLNKELIKYLSGEITK